MSAEIVNISRYSWLRNPHTNPQNIHSVTDMQVWRDTHPMYDIQKITCKILEIPQRNMELSQEITNATMKYWMGVMFWVFWQSNTAKEKEKIN